MTARQLRVLLYILVQVTIRSNKMNFLKLIFIAGIFQFFFLSELESSINNVARNLCFAAHGADELATTCLNHTNILLAQLDLTQNSIYYIKVVVRSITYDSPVSLFRHIFTILLYMV